jgi:maltose alpha-D-glucosyltransferase/alpha-amylase
MQWDASANAGFSSADANQLYLPIAPDTDRPTVASQEQDAASLLNFTRRMIKLRRETPALASAGNYKTLNAGEDGEPYVYERSDGTESYIVAVNPSGQSRDAAIALNISTEILNNGVTCSAGKLVMQPGAYAIFKL